MKMKSFFAFLLFLSFLVFQINSYALEVSPEALNQSTFLTDPILRQYSDAAAAWAKIAIKYASWIFLGLALLSMVWTYALLILNGSNFHVFFAETFKFLVIKGFFWWALVNGPELSTAAIDSLAKIGAEAAGVTKIDKITPVNILALGFDFLYTFMSNMLNVGIIDNVFIFVLMLGIFVVIGLICWNMLELYIMAWTLCYGGVFLLGFGGASWTSYVAVSYFRGVIAIGLQAMGMVLTLGIGQSFFVTYIEKSKARESIVNAISLEDMLVFFTATVALLWLVQEIPLMFAKLATDWGTRVRGNETTPPNSSSSAASLNSGKYGRALWGFIEGPAIKLRNNAADQFKNLTKK